MNTIDFLKNNVITTGRVVNSPTKTVDRINTRPEKTFSDYLTDEIKKSNDLKFSAHALKRMTERDIVLSNKDISDIENAIDRANGKGIKDSLFLLKNVALIVNVPNKTVITAVDGDSLKENVFTNIDGAIII